MAKTTVEGANSVWVAIHAAIPKKGWRGRVVGGKMNHAVKSIKLNMHITSADVSASKDLY